MDFDYYLSPYSYVPASGKTISSIVGMGIASDDHCYTWYADGTVSSGTTSDLDQYISSYGYSVATGKLTSDVVGAGIAPDDHCYMWYKK